jgi:hypothetical protein
MLKKLYLSGILLAMAAVVQSMIKLVGPDETTEDITLPIKGERQISFYRFKSYFDDGNSQYRVFGIARKYFINKDVNITHQNFIQAGKEYLMADLADSRYNFKTIAKIAPFVHEALATSLNEHKNVTYSLEEFFRHTVQGQFKQFVKSYMKFEDQPWEIQQKLLKKMAKKKADPNYSDHHHDHEETYITGHKRTTKTVEEMKKEEARRMYSREYVQVEWMEDGRRVIDSDYDQEEPERQRKLHAYHMAARDRMSIDEVDELLNMDL